MVVMTVLQNVWRYVRSTTAFFASDTPCHHRSWVIADWSKHRHNINDGLLTFLVLTRGVQSQHLTRGTLFQHQSQIKASSGGQLKPFLGPLHWPQSATMDVTFISSGAMSRAQYALVRKVENAASPQAADQILLNELDVIRRNLQQAHLSTVRRAP